MFIFFILLVGSTALLAWSCWVLIFQSGSVLFGLVVAFWVFSYFAVRWTVTERIWELLDWKAEFAVLFVGVFYPLGYVYIWIDFFDSLLSKHLNK